MKTKVQKLWACVLSMLFVVGMFTALPFTVGALELGDIKVENVKTDSDGYLNSFDISFKTTDGSAAADAKMSVGTVDIVKNYAADEYKGLTNYGKYWEDHQYTNWVDTPADIGFICWNSGGTFLRGGSGETTKVTVQFPAKTVSYTGTSSQSLYFYLWAQYGGKVYPDYKITEVTVGNNSVTVGGTTTTPTKPSQPGSDDCSTGKYQHLFVKTEGTPPTCEQSGTATYYTCEVCGRMFLDVGATKEITEKDIVLPATGHNFVAVDANDNDVCVDDSTHTYYKCKTCGKVVVDSDAGSHDLVKVDAKKARFDEDGNKAYYTCSVCGKSFSDEAGTKLTDEASVIIPRISYAKTYKTAYTYNGKDKKSTVTLKDSTGKKIAKSNYTLTYSNTKNIGTAKVKIKLKGSKYSGTKTLTYKIQLPAPKIKSLTNPSARTMKAKWSKVSIADGYQFVYCRTKDFNGIKGTETVRSGSTAKTKLTLLNVDTYYCRVRAYKKINGKTYYSAWSATEKIKISGSPSNSNNNSTNTRPSTPSTPSTPSNPSYDDNDNNDDGGDWGWG